jgi:hypothetical protein
VNVPSVSQVVVVDRAKHAAVASWDLPAHCENFPMGLDEEHHRLFVGCRNPPQVLVLDTITGKTTASAACARSVDDLFWEARAGVLYATGGEGFLDVFSGNDDTFRRIHRVSTSAGARTSLLIPNSGDLYVAAASGSDHPAEILQYRPR